MHGWHKFFLFFGPPLLAAGAWLYCHSNPPTPAVASEHPQIEVWHGHTQRVGHLGHAQDDFNLLGTLVGADGLEELTVDLNGSPLMPLTVAEGRFGFRRLAQEGHFNADIPLNRLQRGTNRIVLQAHDGQDRVLSQEVTLDYEEGDCPLPFHIAWDETTDPQEVGQYVDGEWVLDGGGLRTGHTGYDRIFLIGNRLWQDYEVKTSVTVHGVAKTTGPRHGGNGVGVIMRFAGHIVGGHRGFPEDQPKWGYQPFGAIGWLRWKRNWPALAPRLEYYAGDADETQRYGFYEIKKGQTYWLKMACETLPDAPDGAGVTRYSFKIWPDGQVEPDTWRWQVVQTSLHALRQGGVALLAHYVDATFGDVTVMPLELAERVRPVDSFATRVMLGMEQPPTHWRPLQAAGRQDLVPQFQASPLAD